MSDIDELLGDKPAAKKTAKKAAPAAKAVTSEPETALAARAKKVRQPVVFEEGEKEELAKKIKRTVRKPINSKELAVKLEIPTRKLRQVLYSMRDAELVTLTPGESRVAGMTVSPFGA